MQEWKKSEVVARTIHRMSTIGGFIPKAGVHICIYSKSIAANGIPKTIIIISMAPKT